MPRTQFSSKDLNQMREQLNTWRRSRGSRCRLPIEVWESAASLAREHGVSPVARILRLNFYKLKQRCARRRSPDRPECRSPGFVEIAVEGSAARADPHCRMEWTDGRGAKMTLELPVEVPTLVALTQAFWRRGR
jgi:hypothetical protein